MRSGFRSSQGLAGVHCSRRALLASLPLTALLGALASACSSTVEAPPGEPLAASAQQGWTLVYRKPSKEPFTSLEVEELGTVLRTRLEGTRIGVMAGPQGLVEVLFPDATGEAEVAALRPRIERVGRLSFEGVAHEGTPGWDAKAERKRLESWWAAQEQPTLDAYNAVPHDAGGPPPGVLWRAHWEREAAKAETTLRYALPCVRMAVAYPDHDWNLTQGDLDKVYPTRDQIGYAAVGFEMRPERRKAFGDFTEAYVDQQIAIVLDGVVVSAPVVNSPLRGPSMIQGRFKDAEVDEMVAVLRAPPLPVSLELVELRRPESR